MSTNLKKSCVLASFLLVLAMSGSRATAIMPEELPPGVPRSIGPDGTVYVDLRFTTPAFQEEALRLTMREASSVARDMRLLERLPITRKDVVRAFVGPFGYTYNCGGVGNIWTPNYVYHIAEGYKLSSLVVSDYDARCIMYRRECQLPAGKVDTNRAMRLATKFLRQFRVDMRALERDCVAHVSVSSFWNGVELGEPLRDPTFVPLYFAWWTPRVASSNYNAAASIELFEPTKTLISLTVSDAKYILRPPVVFTNLAELFPGEAAVVRIPPPPKTGLIRVRSAQ